MRSPGDIAKENGRVNKVLLSFLTSVTQPDKKLVIMSIPSNDIGYQETGSNESLQLFIN